MQIAADRWKIFVDATEMIDFNVRLSDSTVGEPFFRLSRTDSTMGFPYNWGQIPGHIHPAQRERTVSEELEDPLVERILLGTHLAHYLRSEILRRFNHPTHAGISTSKVASKLVGNLHKPADQTVLLPSAFNQFMGRHELAEVPGIGSKTARKLRAVAHKYLSSDVVDPEEGAITVEAALPFLTPAQVSTALPITIQSATHIHSLLCGADATPITEAPLFPTQISIEDTFRPETHRTLASVTPVLTKLITKLLQRMQMDLLTSSQTWLAHPRNLRMSIRRHETGGWNRTSRSTLLPSYVFSLSTQVPQIASRLTEETALPLLKKLLPAPPMKWSLQLLNVAAVNMAASERSGKRGIKGFFSSGAVPTTSNKPISATPSADETAELSEDEHFFSDYSSDDPTATTPCFLCNTPVPDFAREAHTRFHANNPNS